MQCPVCRKETHVLDSRVSSDALTVRRRRECMRCKYRFSTLEEIEILDLTVLKRDGKRELYSREKLERGIRRALEKRSIENATFSQLIKRIERDIQIKRRGEITSSAIGEIVMRHLKRTDKIGYIRYASVYRAFEDVEAFKKEIEFLTKTKQASKKRMR